MWWCVTNSSFHGMRGQIHVPSVNSTVVSSGLQWSTSPAWANYYYGWLLNYGTIQLDRWWYQLWVMFSFYMTSGLLKQGLLSLRFSDLKGTLQRLYEVNESGQLLSVLVVSMAAMPKRDAECHGCKALSGVSPAMQRKGLWALAADSCCELRITFRPHNSRISFRKDAFSSKQSHFMDFYGTIFTLLTYPQLLVVFLSCCFLDLSRFCLECAVLSD